MSGNTIGTIVGGVVGYATGNISLGMSIGGFIGGMLIPDQVGLQDQTGPRLSDLKVTSATYGVPINRVFGTYRVGGNIIWATHIKEVKHVEEREVGKGGSETYDVITYTYSIDMAISFCEGEITGIRKIWADGVKIYDKATGGTTDSYRASNQASGPLTIYLGTPDQNVDWFLKANNPDTPAYRNVAYVVFNTFQLEKFGNRIPNITAEIVRDGFFTTNVKIGPYAPRRVPDCIYPSLGVGELGIYRSPKKQYHSLTYDIVLYEGGSAGDIQDCKFIDAYRISNSDFSQAYVGRFTGYDSPTATFEPAPCYSSHKEDLVNFTTGGAFDDRDGYVILRKIGSTAVRGLVLSAEMTPNYGGAFNFFIGFYRQDVVTVCDRRQGTYEYIRKLYIGTPEIRNGTVTDDNYFSGYRRFTIIDINNITTFSMFVGNKSIIYFYNRYGNKNASVSIYTLKYNSIVFIQEIPFTPTVDILGHLNEPANMYVDELLNVCYFNTFGVIHSVNLTTHEYLAYSLAAEESSAYWGSFHVDDNIVRIYDNQTYKYITLDVLEANPVTVSSICGDLMLASNIKESEINITETDSILVDGFLVADTMPARSAISVLQSAFLFDLVEDGWKISTKARGKLVSNTILENDLGANIETLIENQKKLETELPQKVTVTYSNKDIDYQRGSQSVIRISGNSDNNVMLELPIVLDDVSAKKVCEINMFGAWQEKNIFVFHLPSIYMHLTVSDVVRIPYNNSLVDVRITKIIITNDYIVQCESVKESVYTSISTGQDTSLGFTNNLPSIPSLTELKVLNCPAIDNQLLDAHGVYLSACGYSETWKGCEIFKSQDHQTYSSVGAVLKPVINGVSVTKLNSGPTTVWDLINSVEITLTSGSLTQSSIENILSGNQYAILGSEVIQFVDVEENSEKGTFTISKLLRGRRGTEWAVGGHVSYEIFSLLNYDMSFSFATINVQNLYRAVTFGSYLDEAEEISKSYTGVNLIPFSPASFKITTDNYGDTISWARRDRYVSGYFKPLPLTEFSESFTLNVYNYLNQLIRTFNLTNEYLLVYSKQDKLDDGILLGEDIKYEVYQNGTNAEGYKTIQTIEYEQTYLHWVLNNATYFWRFDELVGSTIATELISGVRNLTIELGATLELAGSLSLSNNTSVKTNNSIIYGYAPVHQNIYSVIISFNPLNTDEVCTIYNLGYSTVNTIYDLRLQRLSKHSMRIISSSTGGTGFTFSIDGDASWLQIAFTSVNFLQPRTIYVNGEFAGTHTTGSNHNDSITIGAIETDGSTEYSVNLDELMYFSSRALTADEVLNVYKMSLKETQ